MEKNGGAWCPLGLIDKDSYEYLQIDLGKLMVITKVEVQGRFDNGKVWLYCFVRVAWPLMIFLNTKSR